VSRRWRAIGVTAAAAAASIVVVAALLDFLAPDISYHLNDRVAEWTSGRLGHTYRIALGARTGSSYLVGTVLNRYLREKSGYEIELIARGQAAESLEGDIEFATVNSTAGGIMRSEGVYGIAALEAQYFFTIVPNDSPAQEFRDLAGRVNPGVRGEGQGPTIGERVLDYYGLGAPRVSVVRPTGAGNLADLDTGHSDATTRTQFLNSELIDEVMQSGRYRLVPIRDHEALARALPGASPGFIPAGLYGPQRRIPAQPVPTITVSQILIARGGVPGRVVRDILEVLYDPRFARDTQYAMTEAAGRNVGGLPLHPAADIFYRRNDELTSDRLGRLSFVGSALVALITSVQFIVRYRRNDRVRRRRQLLGSELARLQAIRQRIEESADDAAARQAIREADDLLIEAEQDAAAGLLDADGIQSIRSVHQLCCGTIERRPGLTIRGAP
jgi:TRAP-type uncharacterized transport system substrate-binding protein